jgi:hypothetical protein
MPRKNRTGRIRLSDMPPIKEEPVKEEPVKEDEETTVES